MRPALHIGSRRRAAAVTAAALAVALAAVGAISRQPSPGAVTVYAAASLREVFPQISSATYSFAGSNVLQTQIERGAPADVFAAASPKEAQALFRAGRCGRPVAFATNVVVLITPHSNPGNIRSVYSLRSGGRRIAVANAGVPVGDYTRKLLARLRLSSILRSNAVSQESNVASIASKVALGSADAGFVYSTDATIVASRTRVFRLPSYAQPPVRYQICAVRRSGAGSGGARSFIAKVRSTRGRSLLRFAGFGLPPR